MMFLVLPAGAAWADDGSCAPNSRRQVLVEQDIQKVTVTSDFDLAAIDAMAARFGTALPRPPEGFYIGQFSYTVAVDPAEAPHDCSSPVRIDLQFHLAKRFIEIASELQLQPCRRAAEIGHYQRHADADAAVIARYASLIRDDLGSQPIGAGNMTDWVRSIVDRDTKSLNDDRRAAQNAINTTAEFARIDEACSV